MATGIADGMICDAFFLTNKLLFCSLKKITLGLNF